MERRVFIMDGCARGGQLPRSDILEPQIQALGTHCLGYSLTDVRILFAKSEVQRC